jgi:hypothetical protein
MKRKMFIASAALVFAVSGAFAVKAHSKDVVAFYFNASHVCTQDPNEVPCSTGKTGCTDDIVGVGSGITVYSESTCNTRLGFN